ncbi:hypothetical protein E1301_Tti015358 [Triplophysa tibetana]|uniref:Myb-like domain-containing protein n=2 Tax=Triplophysa tibetana TaxID=1572043 RepID=A0A5A9PQ12_9TELE|nr:hypothetical protein E1301_Tti015358 [Triplophysa tibetana]
MSPMEWKPRTSKKPGRYQKVILEEALPRILVAGTEDYDELIRIAQDAFWTEKEREGSTFTFCHSDGTRWTKEQFCQEYGSLRFQLPGREHFILDVEKGVLYCRFRKEMFNVGVMIPLVLITYLVVSTDIICLGESSSALDQGARETSVPEIQIATPNPERPMEEGVAHKMRRLSHPNIERLMAAAHTENTFCWPMNTFTVQRWIMCYTVTMLVLRNYNVTTQCGLNEGNTAQLLSMSVIAGWSIYEGLLTNILQTQKMEKKRNRKPNWTEEQGLLLAQLVNEHKGMLRGKFGPTVTSQGKRRAWDTISQTINASFPLVVRTGDDCEKRWYVLQSKAKDEISAHKRESSLTGGGPPAKRLSQVADTVFQVLGHSEVSVTGLPTGIDTSMMQALEMQQR